MAINLIDPGTKVITKDGRDGTIVASIYDFEHDRIFYRILVVGTISTYKEGEFEIQK